MYAEEDINAAIVANRQAAAAHLGTLAQRDRSEMEAVIERVQSLHDLGNRALANVNEFLSRMGRPGLPFGRPGDGSTATKPVAVGHLHSLGSNLDELQELIERLTGLTGNLAQIG